MELNQTVSGLQEEVKLLKGEIKSILKEIRTAVLSNDNPFAAAGPAVRVVSPEPEERPSTARVTPPPAEERPASSPFDETAAFFAEPEGNGSQAAPVHQRPAAAPKPSPPREAPAPAPGPQWNALAIAGLTAWAEDTVSTLGPRRYQMVLELASFAGLVPVQVRDILSRLAEFAPNLDGAHDRPPNVVDCVVALHRLEAVLRGENGTPLWWDREHPTRAAG